GPAPGGGKVDSQQAVDDRPVRLKARVFPPGPEGRLLLGPVCLGIRKVPGPCVELFARRRSHDASSPSLGSHFTHSRHSPTGPTRGSTLPPHPPALRYGSAVPQATTEQSDEPRQT